MRMRLLTTKLRGEIENETRVFLESLDFVIEMSLAEVCPLVFIDPGKKNPFCPLPYLSDPKLSSATTGTTP